jgi:hypothetical protein
MSYSAIGKAARQHLVEGHHRRLDRDGVIAAADHARALGGHRRGSWLVKRLGSITHHTRSGPSASAAIAAQIALSIPPDRPSTTPGKRLRST